MKWTTDAPHAPGLYLWHEMERTDLLTVVEMPGGRLYVKGNLTIAVDDPRHRGSWLGPIDEPPESVPVRCPHCESSFSLQYRGSRVGPNMVDALSGLGT